ncbi:HD domain-containing protein [Nostoc sp. ChiQUE01b]|uniref:HD domain-containing protein n=1 Tax=Nostoc sp. ChiQUE01b TaxID=3075376 RepID=UPI002AD3C2C2|nr:HD domain-containing protein [Nostoc sp. ChiQUE01b]MDZ8258497.1 HD domain-containing protein [Nostoc sp. ChiQUE01b]
MNLNSINKPKLTTRFEEALVYATQLHAQQVRRISGVPYVSHLLSVTALVIEDGGSEDEAIAALLHDAIEDQGGRITGEIIRQKFGDKVADIVESCTESDVVPQPSWKERKQKYLENISQGSPEVLRVALADKVHNARSNLIEWDLYGDKAWNKEQRQRTLWFYRSVIAVAQTLTDSRLVEELRRIVKQLEAFE